MVMGRGGGEYHASIDFLINTDDLRRGISVVNSQMGRAERSTDQLARSIGRLDREASDVSGIQRQTRELRDLGREADSTRGRMDALASGIGALAGGFAIGGVIGAGLDRLERIRQARFESPNLTDAEAQQFVVGARSVGLDESAIAQATYDALGRAQEGLSGILPSLAEDFALVGADFDSFANSLVNASNETERLTLLIDLLRSVPLDKQFALSEAAIGDAGRSILRLANDTELANRLLEEIGGAATLSADSFDRLVDAQASFHEFTNAISLLASEFVGALTPAIDAAATAMGHISDAFSAFNNALPGAGTFLAVSVGIGVVGAAAIAGAAALYGLASAAIAAAAPLLPFIAIAAGVVAATLAIGAGVVALANHVGGFGNLWATVWDGIVIATVSAVELILLPLKILIATLNAASGALSRITGGAVNLGTIDDPTARLGQIRNERFDAIRGRTAEARRERDQINITQNVDIREAGDGRELAGFIGQKTVQAWQLQAPKGRR